MVEVRSIPAAMHTTDHIKFTVIIPVLNAAHTIKAVLASLAAQSYTNFEVLIRDGGSTDCTLQYIKRFTETDTRFRCVSGKDNGIYDAMNKALEQARGQWIFFLGSDDSVYDAMVFADVAEAIGQNPNAKLVYGNVKLNQPLGYHHQEMLYAGKFDGDKLLTKNICHQSVFYHHSLFREFGLYRTQYAIFADYDFNLRCFNKVNSVYLDRIIANFNVGGHSKNKQHLDQLFEKEFTTNMVLYYSYPYSSSFFDGKKKELFQLAARQFKLRHLKAIIKTCQILSYQAIKSLVPYKQS